MFEIEILKPLLGHLYGEEKSILNLQFERYSNLYKMFVGYFGNLEPHFFSTPGRTEIGGNHTDHNHGRVLAGSVNLDTIAIATKQKEMQVYLYSEGYDEPFIINLLNLEPVPAEKGTTAALIRGIAARFKQLGYQIGGINACITSDVLPGSGLSSSASIEVLLGTIFNALYNDNTVETQVIALIGQYSENHFFGKPCGLMDQVACAVGGIVSIDFENPEIPVVKKINFNLESYDYRLVVVDTGGNHANLTDDYASIPEEMKSVAQVLNADVMRQVSAENVIQLVPELRKKSGDRAILRSLHFLGENERVVNQVEALESGDFQKFLQLIRDSGNSSFKWLQNIYSTKNVKEQGLTLALALTERYLDRTEGGASRVHGGGFAGTIQAFLPNETVDEYAKLMAKVFGEKSILVLKIRPLGSMYLNSLM